MELLQTFKYGSFRVETYYNGSDLLPNKVYIDNELVYEDNTFRPSPLYNFDDTETMVSLLDFYTLEIGSVDQTYFDQRNCKALDEWTDTDERDEIFSMCFDFSLNINKEQMEESGLTPEEVTRIENYILS